MFLDITDFKDLKLKKLHDLYFEEVIVEVLKFNPTLDITRLHYFKKDIREVEDKIDEYFKKALKNGATIYIDQKDETYRGALILYKLASGNYYMEGLKTDTECTKTYVASRLFRHVVENIEEVNTIIYSNVKKDNFAGIVFSKTNEFEIIGEGYDHLKLEKLSGYYQVAFEKLDDGFVIDVISRDNEDSYDFREVLDFETYLDKPGLISDYIDDITGLNYQGLDMDEEEEEDDDEEIIHAHLYDDKLYILRFEDSPEVFCYVEKNGELVIMIDKYNADAGEVTRLLEKVIDDNEKKVLVTKINIHLPMVIEALHTLGFKSLGSIGNKHYENFILKNE